MKQRPPRSSRHHASVPSRTAGERKAKALGFILLAFVVALASPGNAPVEDSLWASHIEPLLKEHCLECHNPAKTKSGLDLSSLQTILRGGDRGAAVLPGRPNESNLYKFLSSDSDPHMPPAKHKPLGEEEIGLIKKWIQDLSVVVMAKGAQDSTNGSATSNLATLAKPRIVWKPPANLPPTRVVDRFLELAWKLDKVKPAQRAEDSTFARRSYLDLAGRIPTPEEAGRFLKDPAKDKRARLIDTLLASDEYPRQMREVFDAVLMTRRGADWEDQRANQKWFAFLEDAFRSNRPWNEVIRDLIVARPGRTEDRGAVWYLYERQNNAQAIAEALAPVVFGVQVKCAQCHDHMVAREIKQAHYWGMVAAFNRSKNVDTPSGPGIAESAVGGFVSFANLKKESQPALLTFFNGRKIDETWPKDGEKDTDLPDLYLVPPAKAKEKEGENGKKPGRRPVQKADQPAVPKFSRRQAFAEAVTHDNPLLARAMVNRIWAMLFGRGLVHPVELMDSKHPPSHPELLDWLAKDFERNGYDVKRLIRTLCNTRAYQLDSRTSLDSGAGFQPAAGRLAREHELKTPPAGKMSTRPASRSPDKTIKADSFARALDKPLSAEQLFRSVLVATGNRADSEGKIAGRSEKELRRAFVAQFPDLFPAEYNATLFQAMFLSNSQLFDQLLAPREGNLAARLVGQASLYGGVWLSPATANSASSGAVEDSIANSVPGVAAPGDGRIPLREYKASNLPTQASAAHSRTRAGSPADRQDACPTISPANLASSRVHEAFQAIFGREPDADELRECTGYLAGRSPEAGVKQLLWAMLSSAEFQLNH